MGAMYFWYGRERKSGMGLRDLAENLFRNHNADVEMWFYRGGEFVTCHMEKSYVYFMVV